MVANNKNSVYGEESTALAAKVGDGGQVARSRRLRLRRPSKKVALAIFFLIIVIVAGILVINHKSSPGQKVYAEVAGHKIYKKDVDTLIGNTPHVSEHDAATVLADKYLTEVMAKEYGVTVTEKDIEAGSDGADIAQMKKNYPYAYQSLVNQIYFNMLSANNQGSYTGKFVVANFSRYVPYQSPLLAQKKVEDPNIGNPTAIAADKKYAYDFITNLYNQIKAGKITFDQAIQMERDDPVVGLEGYATQTQSGTFSGSLNQNGLLGATSIRPYLESLKPGQITKPFVVRASSSMHDKSTAESYYLMIELDKKSGGTSKVSFSQELNQAKKKYGYKINV